MNAFELFSRDPGTKEGFKSAKVYGCGECGWVHPDQLSAEMCCKSKTCECGAPSMPGWTICATCRQEQSEGERERRINAATKVLEKCYEGPVYVEAWGEGGFFKSMGDLRDHCDIGDQPLPTMVWACQLKRAVVLQLDRVMGLVEDELPDEMDTGDLAGREDLEKALKLFTEANGGLLTWEPDFGHAVIVALKLQGDEQEAEP